MRSGLVPSHVTEKRPRRVARGAPVSAAGDKTTRRRATKPTARLYVVVAHGNGRPYISGVFARMERAQAYLQEIPDGVRPQHELRTPEQQFPLFVLEDSRGFRFFGQGEILEAVSAYRNTGDLADKDYEHAVLYCFKKSYQPEVPGADEMGRVLHRHITNESLEQDASWLLAQLQ